MTRWLTDRSRPVFTVLRRVRPIIATQGYGVVTRAEDVREVLRDHHSFTVALYEPKMAELTGPFILGLDGTQLYQHDHAALRAAVRSEDLAEIAAMTLAAARKRVQGARGRIDVVAELADPVIDEVISRYFGTPGPDTATQLQWARDLFEHIFLNVGDDRKVRDRALAAAGGIRPHLDGLIATRREAIERGEGVPDDVLTRLLTHPPSAGGLRSVAIRHNLIGLISGWIPTVSKAFAGAVDELLRRPDELARAQQAARDGDVDLVGAYVLEAMRFRPQTWALLRTCVTNRVVAEGTSRATTIRRGAKVLLAIQSAMFDERAVHAPREFRVDRPSTDYLHFGHGLHTCFGLEINRVHLAALATALLEGPPVTRAPERAGRLRWGGPYPVGLVVSLSQQESDLALITFPPSLDSEFSRFLLTHYGVAHREERHVMPFHLFFTLLRGRTVRFPLLYGDGRRLNTVKKIIDHYEPLASADRRLVPPGTAATAKADWATFHTELNTATTIFAYHHLLPHREIMVRPLSEGTPKWEAAAVERGYPLFEGLLRLLLRPTDQRAAKSLETIRTVLARVDERLADGRRYLNGDRFTLSDMAFANAASPVVWPEAYGGAVPGLSETPPGLRSVVDECRSRPSGELALRIYRDHRAGPA